MILYADRSFDLWYWVAFIWTFIPLIWAFFGITLIIIVIGGARKGMNKDS